MIFVTSSLRHARQWSGFGGGVEAVGHSTVKMTADVYYHYLEGEKKKRWGKLPSLLEFEEAIDGGSSSEPLAYF
jgi:integrase